MEEEIWKELFKITFHRDYEVSNMGNIRNIKKNVYVEGTLTKDGHRRVCIAGRMYYVYKLVCLAFLENPDNLSSIYHIDNNRTNNKLSNLCWKK